MLDGVRNLLHNLASLLNEVWQKNKSLLRWVWMS